MTETHEQLETMDRKNPYLSQTDSARLKTLDNPGGVGVSPAKKPHPGHCGEIGLAPRMIVTSSTNFRQANSRNARETLSILLNTLHFLPTESTHGTA